MPQVWIARIEHVKLHCGAHLLNITAIQNKCPSTQILLQEEMVIRQIVHLIKNDINHIFNHMVNQGLNLNLPNSNQTTLSSNPLNRFPTLETFIYDNDILLIHGLT